MENNQLAQVLTNAGVRLFESKSYDSKINAQRNLEGRTHYVDNDTLKYFGARILSAHDSCSGCLFFIIESTSLNWEKTKRGVRAVVFDCFGETVYRPDLGNTHKTKEQAKRAMYAWMNEFDLVKHYREKFALEASKARALERDYREAFNATFQEVTA